MAVRPDQGWPQGRPEPSNWSYPILDIGNAIRGHLVLWAEPKSRPRRPRFSSVIWSLGS